MKRRVIARHRREERASDSQPNYVDDQKTSDEFYEAMPATSSEQVYYRDEPDVIERDSELDRAALSGWAIIGLILLAIVVLLLLFGRGIGGTGTNTNTPTQAPATTTLNQ